MRITLVKNTTQQQSFGIRKKIEFSLVDHSKVKLDFKRTTAISNFKMKRKITETSGQITKAGRIISKLEHKAKKDGFSYNEILEIYRGVLDKAKYPMVVLNKLSSIFGKKTFEMKSNNYF